MSANKWNYLEPVRRAEGGGCLAWLSVIIDTLSSTPSQVDYTWFDTKISKNPEAFKLFIFKKRNCRAQGNPYSVYM